MPEHQPAVHSELGDYSHVLDDGLGTFYISGQVPVDPGGEFVGSDDMEVQTRRVFENLVAVLGSVDLSIDSLVKLTVFLVDRADAAGYSAVRREFLTYPFPVSSVVIVASLLDPRWKLEVDAVAVRRAPR